MLRPVAIIIGCLSYSASFVLLLVDLPLTALHELIRVSSDRFMDDGDSLTKWGMASGE